MTPKTLFRVALFSLFLASISSAAEKRPNILFFFTDDQAYDTLGVYGNPDVKTPNIDRLGQNGVVFERHYNTTAICMASRANVMTGLYEYKTGCNFTHGPTGEEQWASSYPILLKQAGYRTGFGGKFGFHVSADGSVPGKDTEGDRAKRDFDFWVGGPGQTNFKTKANPSLAKYAKDYPHSSRAYGAATIDFMRESVKTGKPFCMSVFYKAPHRPIQPDPKFDDVYRDTTFRKLPNYGREAGEHFSKHSQLGRQYPRFVDWGYSEEESYQKALRKYHQLIYGVDYSIGMILDELERLGIADNTVVIFSSDNGYFNGSHGLGSKVLPYEEGARVPLIVYDPRHPQSGEMRRYGKLSANVDITATILDLAGVETPKHYDGRSLLPAIRDTENRVRKTLPVLQIWGPEETRCMTIVSEDYKYIYWYYKDESQGLKPTEELYHMAKDPYELQNVANHPEHSVALKNMRQRYDKQLAHMKSQGVSNNGYAEYRLLFDRTASWSKKKKALADRAPAAESLK
ncbi:sulfatase family protein [Pelagicoccus mobilis]|uniref:Sulfatase n=1 Tax=Pelagicoccus mobilis TaxID=415221 RepID=A0A934RXJ9_9BACT|nr:sulfatase [Pelagicoccus mobilis]MBK1877064.1 sulfatase [Pelagicoccus mobilis]